MMMILVETSRCLRLVTPPDKKKKYFKYWNIIFKCQYNYFI